MGSGGSTETKPVVDDGSSSKINSEVGEAAAVTEEEVTCIICQEVYDLDLHQPKMLDFCHHSFCLSCLKVLRNSYIQLNCLLDTLFF